MKFFETLYIITEILMNITAILLVWGGMAGVLYLMHMDGIF